MQFAPPFFCACDGLGRLYLRLELIERFNGLGGMAIVTAWWGIWHIVAGLTLATWWKRRDPLGVAAAGGRA